MNIGYFSVLDTSQTDFIQWEVLNSTHVVEETKYLKHVRFPQPLQYMNEWKTKNIRNNHQYLIVWLI